MSVTLPALRNPYRQLPIDGDHDCARVAANGLFPFKPVSVPQPVRYNQWADQRRKYPSHFGSLWFFVTRAFLPDDALRHDGVPASMGRPLVATGSEPGTKPQ
jgi:hypothetical protein